VIRGIIFDCFGVLRLDTKEQLYVRFPEKRYELQDLYARIDRGLIEKEEALRELGVILGWNRASVIRQIRSESTLNEPLVSYIATIRSRYKIALLSNIGRGWVQEFFDAHQLHDLFDTVVLSGAEGITKPDPRIFERTAERLGLRPEECIMIDDSAENCRGAEAVGMKSIRFGDNASLLKQLQQLVGEKE
jgi:epoxide hydrolase-like predicted phosphatase